MKNYYEILGVNENSSQDEIKKAYKKLSKQFHPDVNPEGEDRFKEISEAYENIGEESKRQTYDQKRNNPFGNFTNGFDIHSMFEQMMNGGPRQAPKAPDKVLDVVVSPVESYLGIKKELKYTFYNICKPCNGEGGDKKRCQVCNGSGVIIQVFGTGMFNHRIQTQCHGCNGKGSIIENMCKSCSGNGVVVETENLTVSLPKNIDNGDFMRLKNRGDFNTNVKQRGDLILKVTLDNTGLFEKSGSDLIYKKKMTSVELIINEFIDVEHPDGNLKLTKPDMLDTDKPLRVINKGYNINGVTGNFYIKISVTNDKKSKESLLNMMNSTK